MAGSFGSSSSPSSSAGWLSRRPRSRATTSVPKRDGTFRPAARAPLTNSEAAPERPRAETSRASSWDIVAGAPGFAIFGGFGTGAGVGVGSGVGVVSVDVVVVVVGSVVVGSVVVGGTVGTVGSIGRAGSVGGGASTCCRPNARLASACAVRVPFGRNLAGSDVPIRPCAVTARISGAAQSAGAEPAECVAREAAAEPVRTSTRMAAAEERRRLTCIRIVPLRGAL